MIKVLFVCHGNICRSPMAEFVLKDMVHQKGMSEQFEIASAATSTEEIGNPVHHGTRKKLAQYGISVAGKVARRLTKEDYQKYDYLIGMDSANISNMLKILGADPEDKVRKLLSYANQSGDIADPWYTGNFNQTYEEVVMGCEGFLQNNRL